MARILMASSEARPFAQTGGLADVLGALPQALRDVGEDVAVVLPRYRSVRADGARRVREGVPLVFGDLTIPVDVLLVEERGVPFYLLDCPPLFDRAGLYGEDGRDYPDNHRRFGALALGTLAVARALFRPDILHLHDWQTALAASYKRRRYALDPTFIRTKVVLTIHNLGYQGRFRPETAAQLGFSPADYRAALEFSGDVSFLRAGLTDSDWLTTVSPTYAREIQTKAQGFGLEGVLRDRAGQLTGILNGVDYSTWEPARDPHLPVPYSATDLSGKRANKEALLRQFGLPTDDLTRPVLGVVSRFAAQKGLDLLAECIEDLLATEDVTLVVLGSGERPLEEFYQGLQDRHPDRVGVHVGFHDPLAHQIEAGADVFLMPSRYEPCGLNQIYSLRYGTVPVVRATGGLDDTVADGVGGTGFKFDAATPEALAEAIRRALATYRDRAAWEAMQVRGMAQDFSWERAAAEYRALYARLLA